METVIRFPADDQVLVTRLLEVPCAAAYRAWTTPELVERWWSGGRGRVRAEIDLRVGGRWRFEIEDEAGRRATFCGEYRELVRPERIVYTEVLEGGSAAPAVTTVTFAGAEGHTRVTVLTQFRSRRDRDAHRAVMGEGAHAALTTLAQVADALTTDPAEGRRER